MNYANVEVPLADAIADLLLSGQTGARLIEALRSRFGKATRYDFHLGMALAATLWEADRVGLLADLTAASARIAELEGNADG